MIPFGAGTRICSGSTLAMLVIELVLANLVHQSLDLSENGGLTTHRKFPLVAVASLHKK